MTRRQWQVADFPVVRPVVMMRTLWDDEPRMLAEFDCFLCYTHQDPYTTFLLFQDYPDSTWQFARELLHVGHKTPIGDAAVSVYPIWLPEEEFTSSERNRAQGRVGMRFAGIDSVIGQPSSMVLTVPMKDIHMYLKDTYELVPLGEEHNFLDLDGTINNILTH
jgi:hypothetical protein